MLRGIRGASFDSRQLRVAEMGEWRKTNARLETREPKKGFPKLHCGVFCRMFSAYVPQCVAGCVLRQDLRDMLRDMVDAAPSCMFFYRVNCVAAMEWN